MANIKVNYHGLEFTPSSWAEVVAMDASGRVYEYASTPIKKEAHDAWAPTGRYKYVGFLNRHPVDWRDSLIRIVDAHPHADNMALYVEDARETPKPWLRWQLRYKLGGKWEDCYTHPDWSPFWEYRRKPAIKTHVVNGFEVPAPETEPLALGHHYYVPDPVSVYFFRKCEWENNTFDRQSLERGLVFLAVERAILNGQAMTGIDPYKENTNEGL